MLSGQSIFVSITAIIAIGKTFVNISGWEGRRGLLQSSGCCAEKPLRGSGGIAVDSRSGSVYNGIKKNHDAPGDCVLFFIE